VCSVGGWVQGWSCGCCDNGCSVYQPQQLQLLVS
jgi:hypothetical protein